MDSKDRVGSCFLPSTQHQVMSTHSPSAHRQDPGPPTYERIGDACVGVRYAEANDIATSVPATTIRIC